jgi:hypothetical protein
MFFLIPSPYFVDIMKNSYDMLFGRNIHRDAPVPLRELAVDFQASKVGAGTLGGLEL